jgi:serine/threonine protein kinase
MAYDEESLSDLLFIRIAARKTSLKTEDLDSARDIQARYRKAGERIPLSDICIQEGFLTKEVGKRIFRIREEKLASDRDALFRKLVIKNAFASNQDVKRATDIQAGQEIKQSLGLILLDLGVITSEQHGAVLASQTRILKARYAGKGGTPTGEETGDSPQEERYFGNYRILQEYARGGMGIIYRAYHPGLDKEIALKTLLEGEAATLDQIERFHREAKAAARLRHPNIVPVHDVGISEGVHFFTMDFIDGRDMDKLLDERLLSMTRSVEILATVSHALHYAHGHAIIHRDIKPANILIDEGDEPYITDFGLAKDVSSHKKLSLEGMAIGTPEYMSPEQAQGKKKIDARSDVYSVGAVLYKAITGRPPFTGKTVLDILKKIVSDDPQPPRRFRPGIARNLETVCLKCLEKNPDRRYATAEDLAVDLERFLAGEPVRARPPSLADQLARRAKKHRFPLLTALAILFAILITAFVASTRAKEESEQMTAQLNNLRKRVTSLARKDRENRRTLREEIEQVLKNGTTEEKKQARALLQSLGKGRNESAGRIIEHTAAGLLKEAEGFLGSRPDETNEALTIFRFIAGFAPDTPSGRKALQRVQELRSIRSKRQQERFTRTVTAAGDLLSQGKPQAAVRAWQELLPALSDEQLATEAASQIQRIILRENRRYFRARARADAYAKEGDTNRAVAIIKPFIDSDMGDIAHLARLYVLRFEKRRPEEVAKEDPPLDREKPAAPGKETSEKAPEFLRQVSALVRKYDFKGLASLREEISTKAPKTPAGGEVQHWLADIRILENLWQAFRQALIEAAGREVELFLRETTNRSPACRKVKILGLKEKELQIRMMNATMTIPLTRLHPISVARLGGSRLGKGKATEYASGLFLYFSDLFVEAEAGLTSAQSEFPGAGWYLRKIHKASAQALKEEAREGFKAILNLERGKNWRELHEAVAKFRRKYEACTFFRAYIQNLSRLERTYAPLVVRSQEVFFGDCSPGENGGIRLSYGFKRPEGLEDWVWAPAFDSYSMGVMERGEGEIRFLGATLQHLGRFESSEFSVVLSASVPESSGLWGVKVFNLFVKVNDEEKAVVHICRDLFTARPFHRKALKKRKGDEIILKILSKASRISIVLGDEEVYTGDLEMVTGDDAFAVFSGPRTRIHVRNVEITGTPLSASLDEISQARQARQKAERLFRSATPSVLVTPARVSGWDTRDLKSWNHGKGGGLSAQAVDREIDLVSVNQYEDVLLEAVVRASGKGEASIDLHDKSGQEREMILPTGNPGQWFKIKFAMYGGFGWGSINGIPALVSPPYAPILPGLIELDVEAGSSMHIRSLQVRGLKRSYRWPGGWVRMFNGKDLAAWVVQGSRKSWEVRDGCLRARRGEGKVNALQSLQYLKDFNLKLEVKVEKGSASRILFRQQAHSLFVSSIPPDGRWHQVWISARGRKVRATVDGAPVDVGNTDGEDEVNRLGSISLAVERGIVWFRTIAVKASR